MTLLFLMLAETSLLSGRGVGAFLQQHCVRCHGADKAKGKVRLDRFSHLGDEEAAELWERVMEQLSAGEMPPRREPRASAGETASAKAWILSRLSELVDGSDQRGAAMRRLNRSEYANTIRDLFGIDFPVGEAIPQDDSAHGFDNVDDALTLSPLLLEKYLREAERITQRVLLSTKPETIKKRWVGTNLVYHKSKHIRHGPAVRFQMVGRNNGGGAFFPTPIPFKRDGYITSSPGRYRVRVKVHPDGPKVGPSARWRIVYKPTDFATNPVGCEDPRLVFVINGEFAGRIHLTNREPAEYAFTTFAEAGRKFGWNFENGAGGVRAGWYEKYTGPSVIVHWMEIEGLLVPEWPTPSQREVFFRGEDAEPSREYAREILERFARRAFRRPLAATEVDELLAVFDADQTAGGDFRTSIAVAIQRVLCSPQFLFLNRPGRESRDGIDAYEFASRLSYFLWSSMPDDELFAAATDGRLLREPATQIRRMLRDPKSAAFVENFAGQWLQLRKLQDVAVDRALYPDFNDYLRTLLQRETETFFREILDHDLSILNFLDSDFAMLNDRLAHHYGIAGVEGPEFRRVKLDEGSHRGGLTGHASILTLTTCGTRTSPILRGVWMIESLLGLEVPPPPKEVPELPVAPRGRVSQRKRLEEHRNVEACARCHDRIDPLGFPFEHYDVIGRWRTDYGLKTRYSRGKRSYGPPVDGSAEFTSGDTVEDADQFRKLMREGRQELFVRGFARKLLTYALGRGLTAADRPVVDELDASLKRNEYRMAVVYVPIGKNLGEWTPRLTGRDYALSPTLRELSDYRDDFTVLSGLCHPRVWGGHRVEGPSFLTGADILSGTPGADFKNTVSVDQIAAERMGSTTRFRSLELIKKGGAAGSQSMLAWNREGVPLVGEQNPLTAFKRLFVDETQGEKERFSELIRRRKSVLDAVYSDFRRLEKNVGKRDREVLDQYATSVREVELRVRRDEDWSKKPKPRIGTKPPKDIPDGGIKDRGAHMRSMFDIMTLAFQTDSTRIITYGVKDSGVPLTEAGINVAHHGLSHHGKNPDKLKQLAKIDRFHVKQFGYFLRKLKETPDVGGGSLLDNSMTLYGSGLGDGSAHSHKNLPLLLAGRAGGRLKPGQHVAFEKNAPPLTNLFVSMLRHMDVPVESFSDSTGALSV